MPRSRRPILPHASRAPVLGVAEFRRSIAMRIRALLRPIVCMSAVWIPLVLGCSERETAWRHSSPAEEGMIPRAFSRFADGVTDRQTSALIVLRNGRLVYEWYDFGHGPDTPEHTASIAKGLSGLAVAWLAHEGHLDLDAPAANWLADWRADERKRGVHVRELLTHRSGLAPASNGRHGDRERGPWEQAFWKLDAARTPMHVAASETPLTYPPGEGFAYSNAGYAVLSIVLASVARDAPRRTLPRVLRERVIAPLGIPDDAWRVSYGRSFAFGDLETFASWGGAKMSADALARVGDLLLRRGDWMGERVLAPQVVEALFEDAAETPEGWPAAGLGWWSNRNGVWPSVPRDAFLAFGAGQRVVLVIPSLELVVVRLGGALDPEADSDDFFGPLEKHLLEPLMAAFPPPPVPPSERMTGAWFDPASSLDCRADGSDNWPISALPDGSLFAAYGDGFGFEPYLEEKLSQGFAKIVGDPDAYAATNLRSQTGERTGDGPDGAKASGMLALGGDLYMWVRNLENAQLASSSDGGRTWDWGFRFTESFGSPTFLQFGPGYAGARDGYVYVYSQDGPSAYEADDRMVLARVPRESIRERDAYTFFAGYDGEGRARFSSDLSDRAAILEYTGSCRRSEAVFVAGLGRYLLALGFDAEGGFGIFEAPEPWGPWSSVYFTRRFDLGDTHSYRLPTSWISADGHDLHLVVSGRNDAQIRTDAFCVRAFRITTAP